jgi:hypothetical protein
MPPAGAGSDHFERVYPQLALWATDMSPAGAGSKNVSAPVLGPTAGAVGYDMPPAGGG